MRIGPRTLSQGQHQQFDAICVGGAVETLPRFLEWLKPGGRIFADGAVPPRDGRHLVHPRGQRRSAPNRCSRPTCPIRPVPRRNRHSPSSIPYRTISRQGFPMLRRRPLALRRLQPPCYQQRLLPPRRRADDLLQSYNQRAQQRPAIRRRRIQPAAVAAGTPGAGARGVAAAR